MREDIQKRRDELKKVREQIKSKSVKLNVFFDEEVQIVPISQDWKTWGEVELKELDVKCSESTVTAMKAKMGSLIEDHYHEEQENIYVVNGKIKENISGRIIKAGEAIQIEPRNIHSISFLEDSMLIIQWIPKLIS